MSKHLFLIVLLLYVTGISAQKSYITSPSFVEYDNVIDLIQKTGGVDERITYFDLRSITQPHMAEYLYVQDKMGVYAGFAVAQELMYFYELAGARPGDFAKSIIHGSYSFGIRTHHDMSQLNLGFALLTGRVLPQDTIYGKLLLTLGAEECLDSIERKLSPFWRDTFALQELNYRHDFIMKSCTRIWDDVPTQLVLEKGDVPSYQKLMKEDKYGYRLLLAIYMIDQFGYVPAYEDLYVELQRGFARYDYPMGDTTYSWLYAILTNSSAEGVPSELLWRILSDAARQHKKVKPRTVSK